MSRVEPKSSPQRTDARTSPPPESLRTGVRSSIEAMRHTMPSIERLLTAEGLHVSPEVARNLLNKLDTIYRDAWSLYHAAFGNPQEVPHEELIEMKETLRRFETLRQRAHEHLARHLTSDTVDRTQRRRHQRRHRAQRRATHAHRPHQASRSERQSSAATSRPSEREVRWFLQRFSHLVDRMPATERAMFLEGLRNGRFQRLVQLFREGMSQLEERSMDQVLRGWDQCKFYNVVLGGSYESVSDERLTLWGNSSRYEMLLALAMAAHQEGFEGIDAESLEELLGNVYDFAGRAVEHRARHRLVEHLREHADAMEQRAEHLSPEELGERMFTKQGLRFLRLAADMGFDRAEDLLELLDEPVSDEASRRDLLRRIGTEAKHMLREMAETARERADGLEHGMNRPVLHRSVLHDYPGLRREMLASFSASHGSALEEAVTHFTQTVEERDKAVESWIEAIGSAANLLGFAGSLYGIAISSLRAGVAHERAEEALFAAQADTAVTDLDAQRAAANARQAEYGALVDAAMVGGEKIAGKFAGKFAGKAVRPFASSTPEVPDLPPLPEYRWARGLQAAGTFATQRAKQKVEDEAKKRFTDWLKKTLATEARHLLTPELRTLRETCEHLAKELHRRTTSGQISPEDLRRARTLQQQLEAMMDKENPRDASSLKDLQSAIEEAQTHLDKEARRQAARHRTTP